MARRWLLVLGTVASLSVVAGCKETGPSPIASPPEVHVSDAVSREIEDWDIFDGRVEAIGTVEVRPRVSGYITRVAYAEGGVVKAGDLLFVIDQRPYRAAFDSARAQQERAQATESNARRRFERAQKLLPSQAISREEAEDQRTIYEQSTADLRAAEAALAKAALDLDFTEVRAPIAGRTGRAMQTTGNLVSADQTILTSVVSQDPVYVYFNPDERSYLRYQTSIRNPRHAPTPAVRVGLVDSEDFPLRGTLGFIDNRVDPETGTIRARAVVPNKGGTLTPGLYARVQFAAGGKRPAVLVADRAVQTDQDRRYVYVLGDGNTVVKREVEPGKLFDGLRVIDVGLRTNDTVLVDGFQSVRGSGEMVTPLRDPAEAAEAPDDARAETTSLAPHRVAQ